MGILKGKLVKKDDKKMIQNLDIQSYPWLDFKEKDIAYLEMLDEYYNQNQGQKNITYVDFGDSDDSNVGDDFVDF